MGRVFGRSLTVLSRTIDEQATDSFVPATAVLRARGRDRSREHKLAAGYTAQSLFAAMVFELILLEVLEIPRSLRFDLWAFNDGGASAVLQELLRRGLRPNVEFGCNFGLLSAVLGKAWYRLFTPGPAAFTAAEFVLALFVLWALARVAFELQAPAWAIVVVCLAIPFAIPANDFAHGIEAALLSNAVAEQVRHRYRSALALATVACFAEPSLAYVYGLLLLLIIAYRSKGSIRERARQTFLAALPAFVVALSLTAVLGWMYGSESLIKTLVPIHGWQNYRAMGFGMFRQTSHFLYFPGVRIGWYLGTVAGFWSAAMIWILGHALSSIGSFTSDLDARDEVALTASILLTCFALLMFGGFWSVAYYFYLILIGLIATLRARSGACFKAAALLAMLAIAGQKSEALGLYHLWAYGSRQPAMHGLWAESSVASEWQSVEAAARGRKTSVIGATQTATLLLGSTLEPQALYLSCGYPLEQELGRVKSEVGESDVIVIPRVNEWQACSGYAPVNESVGSLHLVFSGRFFQVLYRTGKIASRGS